MLISNRRHLWATLLIWALACNHLTTLTAVAAARRSSVPSSETNLQTSQSSAAVQLCLAPPQVTKGTLTAEAFTDRLTTFLGGDPNLQVTLLEAAKDEAGARQIAAQSNCDYLLLTTLTSDEGTSNVSKAGEKIGGVLGGSVLGGVFKAKPKFSVMVQYTLEMAVSRNQLLTGNAEDKSKEAEKATANVITKLSGAIIKQIKATSAQLPPRPGTANAVNPAPDQIAQAAPQFQTNVAAGEKPRLVVQTAHAGSVTDFAYNHDGTLLATLGSDGTVKLWLTASGKEFLSLSGYRIGGFSFGPDGRTLACISRDGTVRIFNLATGRVARRFTGIVTKKNDNNSSNQLGFMSMLLPTPPLPLVYSLDGRLLISSSGDGIKVRDVATGNVLHTFGSPTEAQQNWLLKSIALSPDGETVASVSGSDMSEIKFWSTKSGKELRPLSPGFARISALEFSQDGRSLVCGSSYGSIKVFETKSGRNLATPILLPDDKVAATRKTVKKGASVLSKIPGMGRVGDILGTTGEVLGGIESVGQIRAVMDGTYLTRSIRSLAFSHDGKTIAYKAGDDTIRVINTQDGKEVYRIGKENAGEAGEARTASGFFSLCPLRFSPDGSTLNSCREYKTIKRWEAATGQETYSLGVAKRGSVETSPFANLFAQSSSARFLNDKTLLTSAATGGIKIWDLEKGAAPQTLVEQSTFGGNIPISSDGRFVLRTAADAKSISVRERESDREVRSVTTQSLIMGAFFSPDARLVLVPTLDLQRNSLALGLKIIELASGREVYAPKDIIFTRYEFSPDGRLLAFANAHNEIKIVQTDTWRELPKIKLEGKANGYFASAISFSHDGKLLAGVDDRSLKVWDVASGKTIQRRPLNADDLISDLLFRPGANIVTYTTYSGLFHWNLSSNQLDKSATANDGWGQLSYSPSGEILALGSAENKVRLFDIERDRELCSLLDPNRDDWMIVTPEGRLDTSRLEDIEEVHWILPSDPFTAQSLEVFMRYYYEPRLLARLLAGEDFAPVPDLTTLNRAQPSVKIKSVTPASGNTVNVTVEVANRASTTQRNAAGEVAASGVYDVRLFRDGQLVGYSTPGDKLATLAQSSSTTGNAQGIAAWRQAHQVKLDANGNATLTFDNIRLPQRLMASQVVFSAYAFNEDRIKSLSDKYTLSWPASPQPHRGRAYIITVGVNAYENSSFNLSFAASDARRMREVLTQRLQARGQYEEVVPVTLISDYEERGNQMVVTRREATKEKFKAVLDVLAGRAPQAATAPQSNPPPVVSPKVQKKSSGSRRSRGAKAAGSKEALSESTGSTGGTKPPASPLAGIPNADKLRAVTPDDFVLILYSSHGYADRAGNFYLIPYDTGAGTQKLFTETVRQRSISSDELSLWLRAVDAGELVLIVDACHSAAAVEGGEFKPGPMGSRGLGQLSYDKGMRILTATQSDNVALENKTIRQGLLTYALTNDGLEGLRADYKPQDKTVMLLEWLEYGAVRVPKLNEEIMSGQINAAAAGNDKPRLIFLNGARGLEDTGPIKPAASNLTPSLAPSTTANNNPRTNTARLQEPALFNFARGRSDIILARSQ